MSVVGGISLVRIALPFVVCEHCRGREEDTGHWVSFLTSNGKFASGYLMAVLACDWIFNGPKIQWHRGCWREKKKGESSCASFELLYLSGRLRHHH